MAKVTTTLVPVPDMLESVRHLVKWGEPPASKKTRTVQDAKHENYPNNVVGSLDHCTRSKAMYALERSLRPISLLCRYAPVMDEPLNACHDQKDEHVLTYLKSHLDRLNVGDYIVTARSRAGWVRGLLVKVARALAKRTHTSSVDKGLLGCVL